MLFNCVSKLRKNLAFCIKLTHRSLLNKPLSLSLSRYQTVMYNLPNKLWIPLSCYQTVMDSCSESCSFFCSIDVVSSAFEGQSAVNRQRMVYKAIWEELQNVVHAVDQMTTRTPEEAASGKWLQWRILFFNECFQQFWTISVRLDSRFPQNCKNRDCMKVTQKSVMQFNPSDIKGVFVFFVNGDIMYDSLRWLIFFIQI